MNSPAESPQREQPDYPRRMPPGPPGWHDLDDPGPAFDDGLPADLHRPMSEGRAEPVAAVVRAAGFAVVPDPDADGTGHDSVLEETGQRLRVQSERDPTEQVLGAGRLLPVRLREPQVPLRGEFRHLPVVERPRDALDEPAEGRDGDIRHERALRAVLHRGNADLARRQLHRSAHGRAGREILVADYAVMDVRLPVGPGEAELQVGPIVGFHTDIDGPGQEAGH